MAHVPPSIAGPLDAFWYRRRFPLRGPRRATLAAARSLSPGDRAGEEPPLTEELLADPSAQARGSGRFLGIYSAEGLLTVLRAHGLLDALAARGLAHVGVELDLRDPFEHAVRLYDGAPARRVGELVAARRRVDRLGAVELPDVEVVDIRWLAIENPDAAEGTALPGQERPGLGLGRAVIDMALAGAAHLGFAAVLATPAHYHLAWMYHPWCRPLDPADEGALLALERATRPRSRRNASWVIARGEVSRDGAPWHWRGPTMCAPLDARLRAWMTSPDYARAAVDAGTAAAFACGEGAPRAT